MQDIKTNVLYYKSKCRKIYKSSECSLPIVFLRDIHKGYLSLRYADDEESKFVNKLKNIDKFYHSNMLMISKVSLLINEKI